MTIDELQKQLPKNVLFSMDSCRYYLEVPHTYCISISCDELGRITTSGIVPHKIEYLAQSLANTPIRKRNDTAHENLALIQKFILNHSYGSVDSKLLRGKAYIHIGMNGPYLDYDLKTGLLTSITGNLDHTPYVVVKSIKKLLDKTTFFIDRVDDEFRSREGYFLESYGKNSHDGQLIFTFIRYSAGYCSNTLDMNKFPSKVTVITQYDPKNQVCHLMNEKDIPFDSVSRPMVDLLKYATGVALYTQLFGEKF